MHKKTRWHSFVQYTNVGLPGIKEHPKTEPFGIWPLSDHSNTKLVLYSDLHCIIIAVEVLELGAIWYHLQRLLHLGNCWKMVGQHYSNKRHLNLGLDHSVKTRATKAKNESAEIPSQLQLWGNSHFGALVSALWTSSLNLTLSKNSQGITYK